MGVSRITSDERMAAFGAAIDLARTAIGEEPGLVSPNARLGSLSVSEWKKVTSSAVSGWICERSRQIAADRIGDEITFLSFGSPVEPQDIGTALAILPALGDFVEHRDLSSRPLGEWSKDDIALFVVNTVEAFNRVRTKVEELPDTTELPVGASATVMAG